jgi:hypothetical protein
MTAKFKMASETCIFGILLSKLQISTDFKNILAMYLRGCGPFIIRAVILNVS